MLKNSLLFFIFLSIVFSCSNKKNSKLSQSNSNSDLPASFSKNENFEKEVKNLVSTIFNDIFPHKKNLDTFKLLSAVNNSKNSDELQYNLRNLFDSQNDYHTKYFGKGDPVFYGLSPENIELSKVFNQDKEYFLVSKVSLTYNNYNIDNVLRQFQVGDRIISINHKSPQDWIDIILWNNLGANLTAKKSRALKEIFFSNFPYRYHVVIYRGHHFLDINIPPFKMVSDFFAENKDDYNNYSLKNEEIFEVKSIENFAYVKLKTFQYENSIDNILNLKFIANKLKDNILSQNKNKLIIDVRNNEGGNLILSDILAYLFYNPNINKQFFPMYFRLKASATNLEVILDFESSLNFKELYNINQQKSVLFDALSKNLEYTESVPMVSQQFLNSIEPGFFIKYSGKEIYILMNSLCYSACDAFVAILKDQNLVTKVIGEDAQTGGGGASVLAFDIDKENKVYFQTSFMQMQSKTENGFRLIEGEGTYADCVYPKNFEDFSTQDPIINDENYIKRVIQKLNKNEC